MPSSGSSARIAVEEVELRRQLGEPLAHLGLALLHLVAARRALDIGAGERVDQPAQDGRGVADQRHLRLAHARRLLGVGVDAHHGELAVDAPDGERVELGADRQHRVGLAPQIVADRQVDENGLRSSSTPRPRR